MPHVSDADPASLTPAQIGALLGSATRELLWGLRTAGSELRGWLAMADGIPNTSLRQDALHALRLKRGHLIGATLFTILPRRRSATLLRALLAYQMILDYVDNVSERYPELANGWQLHRALAEAVVPGGPVSDYYRHHPWCEDGGFLVALVHACRDACAALPSYERVRLLLARDARRVGVLGLNHELDPGRRDALLREWATRECPDERELNWFELSAAASSSLLVLVLLALAAERELTHAEVVAVYGAHWPWIGLATTMLDSYADQADDEASGNHSYVAHYPDAETAAERIRLSVTTSMYAARRLPNGHRHAVIVACMAALFLSKESARSAELRETTRSFAAAGGSLVRLLLPILRVWRLLNGQRAA